MDTLQAKQIHTLILALHARYTVSLCENPTKEDWIPARQISENVWRDAVRLEVTMYREIQ
jgi:hypothetical protein